MNLNNPLNKSEIMCKKIEWVEHVDSLEHLSRERDLTSKHRKEIGKGCLNVRECGGKREETNVILRC
jgi:hypothetical protein